MVRFANPWWFLLVIVVAALGVLLWWRARHPRGLGVPSLRSLNQVLPKPTVGPDEWLGLLTLLGLICMVIAMARPQAGLTTEQVTGKGVDIVLCLDTSGSMRAVDFKPQNRLGAAKEVAYHFIEKRTRDRMGLVVFGGAALTVCPLTSDKRALLDLLKQVEIDMTGVDGTAIGMALATAADRLRESKAASKVILLLTDGSNNMGAIDPITAAKAAAALDIKIYAVGAASPEGGMVPVQDPMFGTRYMRIGDELDEATLKQVAGASAGGDYFRAKNRNGLERVFESINELEKSDYKIVEFTNYRDHYFIWLLLGWILVGLSVLGRYTIFRRLP